jgi:membrane protein required for beta-lactamase induction
MLEVLQTARGFRAFLWPIFWVSLQGRRNPDTHVWYTMSIFSPARGKNNHDSLIVRHGIFHFIGYKFDQIFKVYSMR